MQTNKYLTQFIKTNELAVSQELEAVDTIMENYAINKAPNYTNNSQNTDTTCQEYSSKTKKKRLEQREQGILIPISDMSFRG